VVVIDFALILIGIEFDGHAVADADVTLASAGAAEGLWRVAQRKDNAIGRIDAAGIRDAELEEGAEGVGGDHERNRGRGKCAARRTAFRCREPNYHAVTGGCGRRGSF
jgi:hypothetical protein